MQDIIYHIHHIVPKHAGGTNHPSNLKKVTIEQHAEEHKKLYLKYQRLEDLTAWKTLEAQMKDPEMHYYKSKLGGLKNKGKRKSEEHKRKIALANIGKKASSQTKKKLSLTKRGENNPMYGVKRSEYYKKVTQSLAMKKAWARRKAKQTKNS